MSTYTIDGSGRALIDKDPNAHLDYSLDWTLWLEDGDSISTLAIVAEDVTCTSSYIVGNVTTAWISGGTLGNRAVVTYRITCTSGRIDDRSIYLKIKER